MQGVLSLPQIGEPRHYGEGMLLLRGDQSKTRYSAVITGKRPSRSLDFSFTRYILLWKTVWICLLWISPVLPCWPFYLYSFLVLFSYPTGVDPQSSHIQSVSRISLAKGKILTNPALHEASLELGQKRSPSLFCQNRLPTKAKVEGATGNEQR